MVSVFLEPIHGAAPNETFKKAFINNLVVHAFTEIYDIRIEAVLIALTNQAIDGIIPYVLDAPKSEANGITLHGEAALRIVNIWTKYLNIMLLAGIDVVRQFLHVLHEASHGSSHELREIVGFQVRCLVRDVRIGRTM